MGSTAALPYPMPSPGRCRAKAPIIELRTLSYFVRIVEMGSLSRAAGSLHVAQSALSQQVSALESDLQTPLLLRSTRGVVPTDAGRMLYQHAQQILQQAESARAAVSSCTAQPAGQVALGVPLSLVAPLALPLFQAVRAAYPAIRLQVLEELSGTILEWIKNGRLAVGIAFDDGNLEGLHATPLLEERLFLIVPPKSKLARRKSISLKDVASLDLVLPSSEQGVRSRVDGALARAGLTIARPVTEVNSLTLLRQAAAAGMGATILAWPSVQGELSRGEVAAVEITRPAITRTACLCVSASAPRTRVLDAVTAEVRRAVRDTPRAAAWRGVRSLDT
jgi:LysR family nitrogen assimilation transcriptional regulator